ncbi:preprotein translocase subunit SecG [bacterium]|nr:MAG: preprotein translocase subunit SecG [bacterium]
MVLYILVGLLALDAVILIISIILQPRSQGGRGAAFGGSTGAGTFFGGRGGMDFLTKLTAILSVVFVILIMAVNFYIGSPGGGRYNMPAGTSAPAPAENTGGQ